MALSAEAKNRLFIATTSKVVGDEISAAIDADASATADMTAHLTDTVDAHDASAISNVAAGSLAATTVQGALDELQTDVNTRAVSATLALTTAGNGAALVGIQDATSQFTGTTVEAALDESLDAAQAAQATANAATVAATLAGTGGAGLVGILDTATQYTGTTVEAALTESLDAAQAAQATADAALPQTSVRFVELVAAAEGTPTANSIRVTGTVKTTDGAAVTGQMNLVLEFFLKTAAKGTVTVVASNGTELTNTGAPGAGVKKTEVCVQTTASGTFQVDVASDQASDTIVMKASINLGRESILTLAFA